MNITSVVNYWLKTAEHDYDTMVGLYQIKRYSDCLFFGHIILEKILKALVVKNTKKDAPHIHNLVSLWRLAGLPEDATMEIFLGEVNEFNIRTRYPEYKFDFYKKCTEKFTTKYYDEINRIYKDLCQRLN